MYSKEFVKAETLKYFDGDELATDVWIKKYCLKNNFGELLEKSPEDMHRRLAREFARVEKTYPDSMTENEIFDLLDRFKYIIPGGSQMSGIGNDLTRTSLSNCFVIESPIDSYGGIMKTDEEQIQIMKRRGGVGHDISTLRPSGAVANNSILGSIAGSTLYMERYSNSTREVAQDGRRGALMLSMDVRHPDVDKFIDAKLEHGRVTGANISVRVSDEFMEAVKKDEDFIQVFPIDYDINSHVAFSESLYNNLIEYDKLYHLKYKNDEEGECCYAKRISARKLWDKIIKNAWQSAEPGVLFWDNILKESVANCYGIEWKETSTNPCGEIPLCPFDSCRLTSVNLYSFVINPFTVSAYFDFKKFKEVVKKAQRMMDDLIDLEIEKIDKIIDKIKSDPEPDYIKYTELNLWIKIKEKAILGRRTGLGITAEGDMLAALGLRYGSPEANEFCEEVHRQFALASYKSSIELAKERGHFPIWDYEKEKENPFLKRIILNGGNFLHSDYRKFGRRNISNLTIAPNGTISLMTQTTSGIEPLFMPFYKRRTKIDDKSKATFIDEVGDGWLEYFVLHPKFVEWFGINYLNHREGFLKNKTAKEYLETCNEELLQKYFEESPYYGATANDIDWRASVEMQGRVQKWIDHSISKTVNLPNNSSVEIVKELYETAYSSGCKGTTIYRDGCRSGVLISSKEEKKENKFTYNSAFKRPVSVECDIYHKTALKQNWMVLIGKVNGNPYEIFVIKDVENHVIPYKVESGIITKIKSKTYELTVKTPGKTYHIDNIVDFMSEDERMSTRKYSSMLRHGMHPRYIIEQIDEFASITSFDKVVQRVLKNYVEDKEEEIKCPECGSTNYHAESGCYSCPDCGYAKCG